jgi:integrase
MVLLNSLNPLKAKNLVAGKYADGQGLWLVKSERTRGKWVLRVVIQGKRREMGLGRWPDVSIAEARELAAEARRKLRIGIDPIAQRAEGRKSVARLTVKQAVDSCFEARKAELKGDGEAGRWMSPLSIHVLPVIGKTAIEDVDQHVLKKALEPIWHSKADTARKALNRLSLTLKHAAAHGLEVDLQATMKVRALLGKQRHVSEHIPSMPYKDAPAFYRWLCEQTSAAALPLRFVMLTAARTGEVRHARHTYIDGEILTLPPEVTKTGREHRIPLTEETMSVIKAAKLSDDQDLLFPSPTGRTLSDATMSRLMERMGQKYRPHGFRATFRTWVEEQTDTPNEVAETALGHVVEGPVLRAYQRSDRMEKRRIVFELWERYLTTRLVVVAPTNYTAESSDDGSIQGHNYTH